MESQPKYHYFLYPLSLLYGMGVRIRNLLFDWDLLPSKPYPLPLICVGNLAAGGTGKTPLVEYLIRLLSPHYRVAVLSRGYKRQTSGYVLASEKSTSRDVGDEACQIKHKYPQVIVAVDKNRREGIRHLIALPDNRRPQVILLDDGFQHRYVRPSLSIIVTDYSRLFYEDLLLPTGLLREPASSIKRADVVVVSKCDQALKPIDSRIIENNMDLKPHQPVFFSSIAYQPPASVYPKASGGMQASVALRKEDEIVLLTGIANPGPLIEEVRKYSNHVKALSFPDHHAFDRKDVGWIQQEMQKMKSKRPLILCTEKDAARIRRNPIVPDEWKTRLYCLPIHMEFLFGKGERFDEFILRHITTIINSQILMK